MPPLADAQGGTLLEALNEARLGKFHLRAALTTGMGFFTDAYDLFIIGAALVILKGQWHLTPTEVSLLGSSALIAAFVGAFVFGRIADLFGRKRVYGLEAAIMVVGAIASALAPGIVWLIAFRFVLGVGIGGDYPVSAVLMSEYSNTRDRGKLVGLVFSMQALGLIVGPLVGIALVGAHVAPAVTWRLMLGLGALPAAAVIWFRRRLPESPRYQAQVEGEAGRAAVQLAAYSGGSVRVDGRPVAGPDLAPVAGRVAGPDLAPDLAPVAGPDLAPAPGPVPVGTRAATTRPGRLSLRAFLTNRRYLLTLVGTAGTWFLFDYAYYGNSISTPVILRMVAPHASLLTTLEWTLLIFAVAALPGYLLATATMDRIGHRRLQLIGFAVMAGAFLAIGLVPGVAVAAVPFLAVYAVSYFFSEFGPNTTTFVMSAELFPVSIRTTAHGLSAGTAKVGAFIGVFIFPLLTASFGLRGTLTVTAGFAVAGFLLTLVLPEPARRSLEEVSAGDQALAAAPGRGRPGRGRGAPGRRVAARPECVAS
ncbi:MAG: MFS transporter [Acidimicrobiales bacterium]